MMLFILLMHLPSLCTANTTIFDSVQMRNEERVKTKVGAEKVSVRKRKRWRHRGRERVRANALSSSHFDISTCLYIYIHIICCVLKIIWFLISIYFDTFNVNARAMDIHVLVTLAPLSTVPSVVSDLCVCMYLCLRYLITRLTIKSLGISMRTWWKSSLVLSFVRSFVLTFIHFRWLPYLLHHQLQNRWIYIMWTVSFRSMQE